MVCTAVIYFIVKHLRRLGTSENAQKDGLLDGLTSPLEVLVLFVRPPDHRKRNPVPVVFTGSAWAIG